MVDQVKKVMKMSQNVAIFRLFLGNFLAILAINLSKIGYFGLSTVGNTEDNELDLRYQSQISILVHKNL